ncbi:MAG: metal-dependent hydrolase [Sphingomonadales bacterium]|nr:metal-dependent hydrolase [Sphingomonadales bacterium]
MDNLTHSLIGAVLGQAGLKRKSGLAMPALILAANLPDIDAPCALYGVESLAMRRGLSHGPIALVLLPLLLTGILVWFDRWQARRGTRPAERADVRPGWLLALCYIGALTHPAFDWLNNYGIRLLEPFSHRWFYGDALFIVDPWILAMLGGGVWLSLRRERAGRDRWTQPARAAMVGVLAFVALNIGISRAASDVVMGDGPYPQVAVANAVPFAFWRRDVLWRGADGTFGTIPCSLLRCRRYPLTVRRSGMDDPRIAQRAAHSPAARDFLFWSRLPVAESAGDTIVLHDQRFMGLAARGPFTVELKP